MKPKIWMVILLGLIISFPHCSRKPKTSCVYGDDIPADLLEQVLEVGNEIIKALEEKKVDEIYDRGSELMKKGQTREQFKMILNLTIEHFGDIEWTQLQEAYYLKNKASRKYQIVPVSCELSEGANDIYQVPPNSEVFSLIYSGVARGESVQILVELIKQAEGWKLVSLVVGAKTIRSMTVDSYVELARKAREQGKFRLAVLYYRLAYILADLSPNLDEFVARRILQETLQIKTDYLPQGIPQIWSTQDNIHFEVYDVDVSVDGEGVWVEISWLIDNLDDGAKLKELSDKLLSFSIEKFPEYREFFTGIMVSAHSKSPKQTGQVYRQKKKFPTK